MLLARAGVWNERSFKVSPNLDDPGIFDLLPPQQSIWLTDGLLIFQMQSLLSPAFQVKARIENNKENRSLLSD